ncbi:hypothetical protein B7R21_19275 [Subtercola boreus]|uniref:Uncharacterized protein n=1 Tax=Subtercola boreus TaxID=120213 RepID=A0A3E0V9Y6_9MICO|nr:hypothetical protein B7R21_19275 [Subtercola boreus]
MREMSWYHTSTEPNWPARALDPISRLTEVTKERMRAVGSDGKSFERWAEGQLAKALHVGTYEAAIENMLRRMSDQDDAHEQFYLYRVQLHPESIIEPGVHKEPTNFVGDVVLEEVCTPGVNVYRYVNTREDPSSISLAVNVKAIHSVQGIPIPLPVETADPWVSRASARLLHAASLPIPEPKNALERMRRVLPTAVTLEAQKLTKEVALAMPAGLRDRFDVHFDDASLQADPSAFGSKLAGLAELVRNPRAVLRRLDQQP